MLARSTTDKLCISYSLYGETKIREKTTSRENSEFEHRVEDVHYGETRHHHTMKE